MPALLISVRFLDGRYHGAGDWPPSPARLFQALLAGAARGKTVDEQARAALKWLEALPPPVIAAPVARAGQGYTNYVPNNDLDSKGGDPAQVAAIRSAKLVRSWLFDAHFPLLFAWPFDGDQDHATVICDLAGQLFQLGRGVDMACATGEVLGAWDEAESRLSDHGRAVWRQSAGATGTILACPQRGSLKSLEDRFAESANRFEHFQQGRKRGVLFRQPPKPQFRQVAYDSPASERLFEIRSSAGFAAQQLTDIVRLTTRIRDLAVDRLRQSAWRADDPNRVGLIEKVFIGRGATDADKPQRIRITPLPSIGHVCADRAIRRVLVSVPPDCPISAEDVHWAFSGLVLEHDPGSGEILAELVPADELAMASHYGLGDARQSLLWRSVTPLALPASRDRGRQTGSKRAANEAKAIAAVQQALRHADIRIPATAIAVQREPFDERGQRAERFTCLPRFAADRLWHAQIQFENPVKGPLIVGDGRYMGLGLMAPVPEGLYAIAITQGLAEGGDPIALARALRRAVMARVQDRLGKAELPTFFTGHAEDGTPLRSGFHAHLAFAADLARQRLLIVSPDRLTHQKRRSRTDRQNLALLEQALADLGELRAGAAGRLSLQPVPIDPATDPLLAPAKVWESITPYRVTRHLRCGDAGAALAADIASECRSLGLPEPEIAIQRVYAKTGIGLAGVARLTFRVAVSGPLLIGRDRHLGGGLFAACRGKPDRDERAAT